MFEMKSEALDGLVVAYTRKKGSGSENDEALHVYKGNNVFEMKPKALDSLVVACRVKPSTSDYVYSEKDEAFKLFKLLTIWHVGGFILLALTGPNSVFAGGFAIITGVCLLPIAWIVFGYTALFGDNH